MPAKPSSNTQTRTTTSICIVASLFMLCLGSSVGCASNSSMPPRPSCGESTIKCVGKDQEFRSIQRAIASARAGDQVWIRSGDYEHPADGKLPFIIVNNSGTQKNPLIIQAYPGENVRILGWGFPEDGTLPRRRGEILLTVNGDYVTVRNIDFAFSSRAAIHVNGDFGTYENLRVYDNWKEGIVVCRDSFDDQNTIGNTFRHLEIFRIRHGAGWLMGPRQRVPAVCDSNTVEKSLFHSNGYQPDGEKVDPIPGDPAGGGNSDGIALSKECENSAKGGSNLCTNFKAKLNIVWNNADDGIDVSPGRGTVIRSNIAFNNGPEGNRGLKVLRNSLSNSISFYDNIVFSNGLRGFEIRSESDLKMYHNTAFQHPTHGFIFSVPNDAADKIALVNNHSFSNGTYDRITSSKDNRGNLWHIASSKRFSWQGPTSTTLDFNQSDSIIGRWMSLYWGIRHELERSLDDRVVDKGIFIAGFHCEDPDSSLGENELSDEVCRHWLGNAPDVGAIEIR